MVVVTNLPPPTHGIRHQQQSITAVINNRTLGKGTLYIAESHLSWVNNSNGDGFSLEYPHITIHAVSRDLTSYPEECLYLILDADIDFNAPREQPADHNDDSDSDEDEDTAMTEMRFIPEDKSCLDTMFSSLSDCQALHPDSQDSFSEDEGQGEENGDDNEEEEEYDEYGFTRVRANHNGDSAMDVDEGQFDDADN